MTRRIPTQTARLAYLTAAVLTLSACGGGSDDDPNTSADDSREEAAAKGGNGNGKLKTEPSPSPSPEPAPAPSPTPDPLISANCGFANFSTEALQRINAYRAKGRSCGTTYYGPAAPLSWNAAIITASTRHSTDMQKNNFTSHTGSDGSNGYIRMTQSGYALSYWGENIGWGFGSVQAMVDWWMSSPSHCGNLMSATFQHVGMACMKGTSSNTWSTYWTLNLGRPR